MDKQPARTIFMQLDEISFRTLCAIAQERKMTKTGVVRRALELYGVFYERIKRGDHVYLGTEKEKSEIILMF